MSNHIHKVFHSGILVAVLTSGGVPLKEELRRTTHNIRCWATRHNYTLRIHALSLAVLRTGYSQPYGPKRTWHGVPYDKVNDVRHRVVAQYLLRHSHVLHIDTDTIALNETRSLRPYTRHPAAVTLQLRENGEVAAAAYLVRRSAESDCFLTMWDAFGHTTHANPRPMLNTDNGVLLLLVGRLLDERAGPSLLLTLITTHHSINHVFVGRLRDERAGLTTHRNCATVITKAY